MKIENARTFFEAITARGQEPRLADTVGSWEFDIEDTGKWTVIVDHGALSVTQSNVKPTTRLRLREDELLRLVHGDGHQNLFTALIRGAVVMQGELAFAQRLQTIIPIPDEWRTGS